MDLQLRWRKIGDVMYNNPKAAAASYGVFLYNGDRKYIESALGYVDRLNAGNTVAANDAITRNDDMCLTVRYDTEVKDFPIPKKAQFIYDAIKAAAK